jgi:cell wall-associated NlpC family hydrolase
MIPIGARTVEKMITNKRRLLVYVGGLLIVANVVANVGSTTEVNHEFSLTGNPSLEKKIAAFKETGVEKKINTDHYDKEGVIEFARSLIGTPHKMGGYSSSGLDCSGLVKMAHAQFDVELPRSSHDQARYGAIISGDGELRRGDLVFFHSTFNKDELVTHAGIYLGDNKFIHTSTKRGVIISTLYDSGYYQKHYLFATRLTD